MSLTPTGGDETRLEFHRVVALPPGRYQVRYNVTSSWLKASGSVYADVEVPDLQRSVLALSGVALGRPNADDTAGSGTGAPTPDRADDGPRLLPE